MTRIGRTKYLVWLQFCRNLGWSKAVMPRLADLWLEYHDDNGDLK